MLSQQEKFSICANDLITPGFPSVFNVADEILRNNKSFDVKDKILKSQHIGEKK